MSPHGSVDCLGEDGRARRRERVLRRLIVGLKSPPTDPTAGGRRRLFALGVPLAAVVHKTPIWCKAIARKLVSYKPGSGATGMGRVG